MSDETGGTIEVEGTIHFKYRVHSRDCNVFSLTELIDDIKADPINWFIDQNLGQTSAGEDDDSEEKYSVIEMDARPIEEIAETTLKIEVLEKYLCVDPDTVPFEDWSDETLHIPLDKDDPRP